METLIHSYNRLIETGTKTIKRELADQIDWSHRLIAIKGSRGVGKTTFLLEYAKDYYKNDESCLYINLNHLLFADRSLFSFVEEFHEKGGKILLLDQIHKYPLWAEDLLKCYSTFEDLRIVFTASSILKIKTNKIIKDCVKVYYLKGLSFREFLNNKTGNSFKTYSLDEILNNHEKISEEISASKPLDYFEDYLQFGYYPFYLEARSFNDSMLKLINLTLEFDIPFLNQIELKYLQKMKKLLYRISCNVPLQPNVSKLSSEIQTSRATVMNYLSYLKDARLIYLLTQSGDSNERTKKPNKVYMHNTNLLFAISEQNNNKQLLCETFFYNQLNTLHTMNNSSEGKFTINNTYCFDISVDDTISKLNMNKENNFIAKHMINTGSKNIIPIWLFGFLY